MHYKLKKLLEPNTVIPVFMLVCLAVSVWRVYPVFVDQFVKEHFEYSSQHACRSGIVYLQTYLEETERQRKREADNRMLWQDAFTQGMYEGLHGDLINENEALCIKMLPAHLHDEFFSRREQAYLKRNHPTR